MQKRGLSFERLRKAPGDRDFPFPEFVREILQSSRHPLLPVLGEIPDVAQQSGGRRDEVSFDALRGVFR